jgi:hypothetical protein
MSTLYWLRLPEHTDMFTEGYIGVAADMKNRLRSHKHRLKNIWDKIIVQQLVVSTKEYCFELEKQLRPSRKIGWNKSCGGYRNNQMNGVENPNFGKLGQDASNFVGWYITPLGKFDRPEDAAKVYGCYKTTIIRRCRGREVNGKFLSPHLGYAFEQKVG